MNEFRVLLTDFAWPDVEIERTTLAAVGAELIVAPSSDEATLRELARDADAFLTCWAKIPAVVIDAAPRLRVVSRLGIGLDNIDVAHCTSRGVVVTNVPDYCLHEVAEHTLALLLALARRIGIYHQLAKQGRYDLAAGLPLRRVAGQTLGIVGLGNIGRKVAETAAAIGLRVIATSRKHDNPAPRVEWRTLDELLTESDFVSLHVPATPETHRLIDAAALARMKPTAFLINTSRGAVVDETALSDALAADRIAGAALDVQGQEPPDLTRPLFADPRVIVTPHAAFVSVESVAELRRRGAQQVADVLLGRVPPHVVNPRALGGSFGPS